MSHRAEVQYYSHDFRAAVATCRDILQGDPHHLTCLPVYLCTLHELEQKNELFYREYFLLGSALFRSIPARPVLCCAVLAALCCSTL
jgi:hypothetical protein